MRTYIHTYIHTFVHTYRHTHRHKYMRTYIPTCIHTYIHTYIHTCMHAYTHTYMHTCTHAYIPTCIHTHIHICMYVYTYKYVYMYMFVHIIICVYTYMHAHRYSHVCIYSYISPSGNISTSDLPGCFREAAPACHRARLRPTRLMAARKFYRSGLKNSQHHPGLSLHGCSAGSYLTVSFRPMYHVSFVLYALGTCEFHAQRRLTATSHDQSRKRTGPACVLYK